MRIREAIRVVLHLSLLLTSARGGRHLCDVLALALVRGRHAVLCRPQARYRGGWNPASCPRVTSSPKLVLQCWPHQRRYEYYSYAVVAAPGSSPRVGFLQRLAGRGVQNDGNQSAGSGNLSGCLHEISAVGTARWHCFTIKAVARIKAAAP